MTLWDAMIYKANGLGVIIENGDMEGLVPDDEESYWHFFRKNAPAGRQPD